jgi:hypothetical protein
MAQLAGDGYHSVIREVEPGLTGIASEPDIGVGQRALLVRTEAGNLLWDPSPFVDDRRGSRRGRPERHQLEPPPHVRRRGGVEPRL